MRTKAVFQLDTDGFLVGPVLVDESPMEPGLFPLPFGCVEVEPLAEVDGMRQQFIDGKFHYVAISTPPQEPEHVPTLNEVKATMARRVDANADAARLAVAGDPLRLSEYKLAEEEARRYQESGYTIAVPRTVTSWADVKGWTAQQAAESILAKAEAWYEALYAIRDARLRAKEQIRKATTEQDAVAIADAATVGITAMVANLGNAAA